MVMYVINQGIIKSRRSTIPVYIKMSLPTASCLVLLLMSYERYRTIVNPFKMPLRKIYILLILLIIPNIFISPLLYTQKRNGCGFDFAIKTSKFVDIIFEKQNWFLIREGGSFILLL